MAIYNSQWTFLRRLHYAWSSIEAELDDCKMTGAEHKDRLLRQLSGELTDRDLRDLRTVDVPDPVTHARPTAGLAMDTASQ